MGLIAAAVGGLAVIALIVLAAVLLPKSCKGNKNAEGRGSEEPTVFVSETPAPTAALTAQPSPAMTSAPAYQTPAAPSGEDEPSMTALPVQTMEERSLILAVLTVDTRYSQSGSAYYLTEGGASVSFVNNTDVTMYSAAFSFGGLEVSRATVNGAAASLVKDNGGVMILPFFNELAPGQTTELYFEFLPAALASRSLILPAPAYDTVYDIVCFVYSKDAVEASAGEVAPAGEGAFRIEAEGVRELTLSFIG